MQAFWDGRLGFLGIADIVAAVLAADDVPSPGGPLDVDAVLAADAWSRDRANETVGRTGTREEKTSDDPLDLPARVVLFVLGVVGSIALHEVGHMVPAKKFGVKVTQYIVGFGKTIWSHKRGDTEYGVKMFPFGGLHPDARHAPTREARCQRQGQGHHRGRRSASSSRDARAVEYETSRRRTRTGCSTRRSRGRRSS